MSKEKKIREVLVTEWYEKNSLGVFKWWEFQDGTRQSWLTPFEDIPFVEIKLPLTTKGTHDR